MTQYCGIVTLLGESNAGKSSVLNAFAKAAFAEVHHKRNLTREVMRAVITRGARQLVLEDTAGLNAEVDKRGYARRGEQALSAARHADLTLWIVDAARGIRALDALLRRAHQQAGLNPSSSTPLNFFVALNKTDLLKDKRLLLPLARRLEESTLFYDIFMLSAKNSDGIDEARARLMRSLPERSFLYEREGDTRPPSLVACETTRAVLYDRLHDELPYDAVVACEQCEQCEDGAWHIAQTILLKRDSQRKILLAREGRLLQVVRERAQNALQRRFASPVSLRLHLPRPRQR